MNYDFKKDKIFHKVLKSLWLGIWDSGCCKLPTIYYSAIVYGSWVSESKYLFCKPCLLNFIEIRKILKWFDSMHVGVPF